MAGKKYGVIIYAKTPANYQAMSAAEKAKPGKAFETTLKKYAGKVEVLRRYWTSAFTHEASDVFVMECDDPLRDHDQLAFEPQPDSRCRLVVAAPTGVQLGAGGPGDLGHAPFDRGVDVFVARGEDERVGQQLGPGLIEGRKDRVAFGVGDQASTGEADDMGTRALDIVGPQPAIEREALGEGHQLRRGTTLETAVPQRFRCASAGVVVGRAHGRTGSTPARSRNFAANLAPVVVSSAITSRVSSPATVPSTPVMPDLSSADATTWAQPGGVRITTL